MPSAGSALLRAVKRRFAEFRYTLVAAPTPTLTDRARLAR
jgi:hypothetical protein